MTDGWSTMTEAAINDDGPAVNDDGRFINDEGIAVNGRGENLSPATRARTRAQDARHHRISSATPPA